MANEPATSAAASERTTVRRGAPRAVYGRNEMLAIIDEALLCHVGVNTDQGPIVLPMAHGRDDTMLYLHGASANALLGESVDAEICATFTLLDGLVVARSPFHNSMNYRSVVLRGVGRRLEGDDKVVALRAVSDHIVATWDSGRPPSDSEIRRTLVLAVPLVEMSAKCRTGDPVDEPEDVGGRWWAGVVPLRTNWGAPRSSADLDDGIRVPSAVTKLSTR